MAEKTLKIMTVSLMSVKKFKAYAVYDAGQLMVTDVIPITGMFGTWKQPLIDEVKQKRDAGFAVLVEERTDHIARHGTRYLLEEEGDSGQSNFYDALDWYFALSDLDNVILHSDCQQYAIRIGGEGAKVEKRQDDKGRTVYNVNWSVFNGGFRAVLMCAVAAMQEPVSRRFIDEFCTYLDTPDDEELHPAVAFARALEEGERQRARALAAGIEERSK